MRCFVLFVVILFSNPNIIAQSVLINATLGYSNHTANIDLNNPPTTPTVANIGTFYYDDPIFGLKALYIFNDLRTSSISHFTGILFEYSSLNSDINQLILGEDLSITSLGFSIGLKKGLTEKNSVAFITISLEYLNSFYTGKSDFNNGYNSESTYKNASMIRGVVGVEYLTSQETPIIIGISSSFGYGTTTRGDIKFYDGDKYLESLAPTGDLVLPDVILNFFLNVSYLIEF